MSEGNTAENLEGQNTATQETPAKPKGKVGRPLNDPKSRLTQARALFLVLNAEGKNRDDILTEFKDKLGITHGTAQVYYHDAKNKAIEAGVTVVPRQTKASKKAAAAVEKTTEGATETTVTAEATPVEASNEPQSAATTTDFAG